VGGTGWFIHSRAARSLINFKPVDSEVESDDCDEEQLEELAD